MEMDGIIVVLLLILVAPPSTAAVVVPATVFREYIGAEFNDVKFSDVPINPNVEEFHFLLSFAIDFDSSRRCFTNGVFNVFWDSYNLSPSAVAAIKKNHSNVRVGVSLGGDSVGDSGFVYFKPSSIASWVSNAERSLTKLINTFKLDGIDIDYEHFESDPNTFAECIGQLIRRLKKKGVISFASIAPFDDTEVQAHYLALWKRYGHLIDYVNFQFYAYDKTTTVHQFIKHFKAQSSNYEGGRILASLASDDTGGLLPKHGFFKACRRLRTDKLLHGIFIWSADDSQAHGFRYEKKAQALLQSPNYHS
ncbi:chitinase 2-like [Cucurbita pepo subsp. pepo]|uniref:chitinase 2-like n=1 Tax=Cucurbita pepo subsp. pepo TaxID=3664 RepID=UPI000C9DA508|nr:chitinase 2-like [Cucurbita pepo subsp. pepo]